MMSKDSAHFSRLTAYLHWKYRGEPVYSRGSLKFPLAVYPIAPDQHAESILHSLTAAIPDESLIADPTYHQRLLDTGKHIINLPTYTMRQLNLAPYPHMDCALGMYYSMLNTCDALSDEIHQHQHLLQGTDEQAFQSFDHHLTLRNRLHAAVPNPVRDGSHRSVALAVSVMVAFQREDGYAVLMQRRSSRVAVGAGLLHVTPSFMLQPITDRVEQDFSVIDQVYREYLEELFNRPEIYGQQWRHLLQDPEALYLQSLLEHGEAAFHATGIVVNLFNLRPEITLLLVIRSQDWSRRHLQGNSIHTLRMNDEHESATGASQPVIIPLYKNDSDADLMQRGLSPDTLVPMASGAIWLGIDRLRQIG